MYSSNNAANARWKGDEKIVIGIDIGTTHTAVAYAYLYTGGPQVVKRVASWPGQAAQRYESKIPSIIWYDNIGRPQAFCAEARSPAVVARAEREQWYLAEQFKLHVHPPSMASSQFIHLIPLPPNVTIEQIYADILAYLYHRTQLFFQEKEFELQGGGQIWHKLASQNSIDFILAHPSGWGLEQQSMLRRAAVKAGLVPSQHIAAERVQFIGEAEASVHYVMVHADLESRLQPGIDFAVCDAGGSTVDTTLYTVSATTPALALREKRDSACIQAGGIFVDQSATEYFQKKFYDGDLNPDEVTEYVNMAIQKFITEIKPSFENPSDDGLLAVADRHFSNANLGIDRGYMTLKGTDIEKFFKTWVDQIIQSIRDQISYHPVRHILLVGGFGESPYLRKRLQQAPGLHHIQFTSPDQSGAKAASEGSVLWVTKKSVVARATRFAFGIQVFVPCDQPSASQLGRPLVHRLDGSQGVSGGWSQIVQKGRVLEDGEEISCVYTRLYDSPNPVISSQKENIYMYDQSNSNAGHRPTWLSGPFGELMPGFQEVCAIEINVASLSHALQKRKIKKRSCFELSKSYWVLDYQIAISFGSTELKAFLVWEDGGRTHRGPATIIPISRAA